MPNTRPTPRPATLAPAAAIIAIIAIVATVQLLAADPEPAPTPPAFANASSPADLATDRGPVLAIFTADWCAPCQHYKRDTLNHPDTQRALAAAVRPVLVDTDEHPDIAERFNVTALPTTVLIKDNRPAASFRGPATTQQLIDFLNDNAIDTTPPAADETDNPA